jgi:hemerythrin superfamily protein
MDTYEKKYKEAIERMKSWARGEHPECFSEAQKTAEFIFPELKESEDERIRKELLEHCKNQAKPYIQTGNKCPQIQSWIAWLEKQGEDKKEMNNFNVLPGLYKCVHRMFDGTPDDKLLFEVGNIYKCLSKHDRAEFEVSYGHSVYLEDPVVCKHFIPYKEHDWGDDRYMSILQELYFLKSLDEYEQCINKEDIIKNIEWLKSLKQRMI